MQLTIEVPDEIKIDGKRWRPITLRMPKKGDFYVCASGQGVLSAGCGFLPYEFRVIVEPIPDPVWPAELPRQGWLFCRVGRIVGNGVCWCNREPMWNGDDWRCADDCVFASGGLLEALFPGIKLPDLKPGEKMQAPGGEGGK